MVLWDTTVTSFGVSGRGGAGRGAGVGEWGGADMACSLVGWGVGLPAPCATEGLVWKPPACRTFRSRSCGLVEVKGYGHATGLSRLDRPAPPRIALIGARRIGYKVRL